MNNKKETSRRAEDIVSFEAIVPSESGNSMFAEGVSIDEKTLENFQPGAGRNVQAGRILQGLGFTVRNVGDFSISAEGPMGLWEKVFKTRVKKTKLALTPDLPGSETVEFLTHIPDTPFTIPEKLQGFVERAYPQRPPFFFQSPLPPRVKYHHLNVPSDVGMVLRANQVHRQGVTGKGILVAMTDTGFYKHPFYDWHGFNYNATLSPDATNVELDQNGHGTAEAANIFSSAPDIDFIGVKMGMNPTLAFKTASDLHPSIITNSWGYHLPGLTTLPNFLKPLEAAVIQAVKSRGITVCFSAGNGHVGFPGMMPQVISVGGVYTHPTLAGNDFKMEASDYASSFTSLIYPGRHVPDICGLVGKKPRGIYIMLPLQAGCSIDQGLAGNPFPNRDETAPKDGWAVISGTSASSPQIAGVCALLKQAQPGLSPALVKAILRASGRDVKTGKSAMGQPAGPGHDGATGAGLVDAVVAYKLARSVKIRPLLTVPRPL